MDVHSKRGVTYCLGESHCQGLNQCSAMESIQLNQRFFLYLFALIICHLRWLSCRRMLDLKDQVIEEAQEQRKSTEDVLDDIK